MFSCYYYHQCHDGLRYKVLLRNAGHWFTTSHSPESLVDSIDDRSAGSLLELLVSCCRPALLPSLSCFALCCVKKYSFQEFKNTLDTLFIEQRSLPTSSNHNHTALFICASGWTCLMMSWVEETNACFVWWNLVSRSANCKLLHQHQL